jgi:hypothetical protein
MENFAEYILNEKNLVSKIEIAYYLSKRTGIYFNKSVIFKTELARQFIEYMKLDVDKNLVLTASLLCNCKKMHDAQRLDKVHSYAKEGANYLSELGFDKRFCKICEEVNRYSQSNPRERESDILELVDQFGGMLLDRPERIGLETDEALTLLEHRNLKDTYNRFLHIFTEFVNEMETIFIEKSPELKKLVRIFNRTEDVKDFVREIANDFVPKLNKEIANYRKEISKEMLEKDEGYNPNRALFSEETTRKIMGLIDKSLEETNNN